MAQRAPRLVARLRAEPAGRQRGGDAARGRLSERINQALMGDVEPVEVELRRKVEEANGMAGHAEKVAEYYRKLSKRK